MLYGTLSQPIEKSNASTQHVGIALFAVFRAEIEQEGALFMGRGEGDKQTDRDRAAVGEEGRKGVRHSTQLSSSSSSSPRYLLPPFVRAQVHPTSFGRRTTAGSLFCAPPFRWVRGRFEHRFAEKNGVYDARPETQLDQP